MTAPLVADTVWVMKIQNIDGTERNETRTEILARHAAMIQRHNEGMALLESIHAEIKAANPAAVEDDFNEREAALDAGLTTEINRSTSLVNVADTNENCMAILKRHKDWAHAGLFLDKTDLPAPAPVEVKPARKIAVTDYAAKLLARKK